MQGQTARAASTTRASWRQGAPSSALSTRPAPTRRTPTGDKNLLLSAEAEADSKPSLEIYADDVKCGHGATAGAVAEEAIFYLRSRGLDEQTAMRLLIQGFASEVLDGVDIESLRANLEALTMTALSSRRATDSPPERADAA
jgi:Fe-S cluster assembly scaffold protein SufB